MIDYICQILIVLLGSISIWLVGRKESYRRYGFLLGLCSQPFWFYTTIKHQQWGIFVLNIWYTYAWVMGLKNHWR